MLSKNKDILIYNQSTVIKSRKFNIDIILSSMVHIPVLPFVLIMSFHTFFLFIFSVWALV